VDQGLVSTSDCGERKLGGVRVEGIGRRWLSDLELEVTKVDEPGRDLAEGQERNWPKPFTRTKAADEIIEKVRRGRAALHQVKTATDH
jgi:hypothetical protein